MRSLNPPTLDLAGAGGLLEALRELSDPRSKRGIRHQVAAILTMVAAATISGARSFRSVADYIADLPPEALTRLGVRHHPVTGRPVAPSEATIRRTVKDVDADEADTIVGTWLHAKVRAGIVAPQAWRGLALDGKTLKGAWEEVDTGAARSACSPRSPTLKASWSVSGKSLRTPGNKPR